MSNQETKDWQLACEGETSLRKRLAIELLEARSMIELQQAEIKALKSALRENAGLEWPL
jgi:hypothetical protein